MKAKLSPPAPKTAAGVNISEEKAAVISKVMSALGGSFQAADKDCGADSIGFICGIKGYAKNEQRLDVSEELLIFSGLTPNELNKAVNKLRDKGCSIPLKAMVTQHNREWTVSALAKELAAEHEYMTSRRKRDGNG